MRYPNVRQLYKYRALRIRRGNQQVRDRRLIDSITDEGIWVPHPDSFNDPFDCNLRPPRLGQEFDEKLAQIIANMESNPSQVAAELCSSIADAGGTVPRDIAEKIISGMWSGKLRDISLGHSHEVALDGLWESVKKKIGELGVFCLSEAPDNPLLWAHYADEHRGFCIEFERSELNILGNDKHTFPVRYSKTYPNISMSNLFVTTSSEQKVSDEETLDQTYIGSVLLTKSEHWSYENEWRMIGVGNNILTHYPGRILSIIFGLRMPLVDRKFLKRCYGNGVIYREVVMENGSFSLKLEDV